MRPRTLFGRTALVIALVSFAFQVFTVWVIIQHAVLPLGRLATGDFAALMVDAAHAWRATPAAQRAQLQDHLAADHRIRVQDPPGDTEPTFHVLPYFFLLESALGAAAGEAVDLRKSSDAEGMPWYWADLPAGAEKVRVGFPASRVQVQPTLALLLIFFFGVAATLLASAWLARRLIGPLAAMAQATQGIARGRRPEPLPEAGPAELAALAREFNRMGEQVEELLANRTTLLAGISHDLRTPLARVQLALGMMSEKPAPDLIARAMRDVEGMNQLIARCLEVSRDFAEQETVDFDLCELCRGVAEEFAQSGVAIRGHKGPDCRVRARPLALRRIMANLIDNAVRYGGGQTIDIEYRVAEQAVEICVLDRGPGIPEAQREAVFRPFYRLEPSRNARTGGSGLGLAIVRQLCTANGWTVRLAPRPGGGTAACVRLPMA